MPWGGALHLAVHQERREHLHLSHWVPRGSVEPREERILREKGVGRVGGFRKERERVHAKDREGF